MPQELSILRKMMIQILTGSERDFSTENFEVGTENNEFLTSDLSMDNLL